MIYYEAIKANWDNKIRTHESINETKHFIETLNGRIKKDSSYSKLFKTKKEALDFKLLCLKEEILLLTNKLEIAKKRMQEYIDANP